MPWAGGSFSRTDGTRTGTTVWAQAKAALVKIIATDHDTHDQDLATGINSCINKDGSNAFTADADLGNNQVKNVAAGTAATDAATIGGTETLTGKTLTAPTLTGAVSMTGTITGAAPAILLRGHIDGLTLSRDTDTDHDINVTAGVATADDQSEIMVLSSEITKQIDAAWAVGDDAGGLDTGAVGNSTWYHIWLIRRSDTGVVDALFSASATAPTMPANYDQKRRIGAVKTDGSANILAFNHQQGGFFQWAAPPLDIDLTSTLTTTRRLDVISVPTGVKVRAKLRVVAIDATSGQQTIITDPDETDAAPSSSAAPLATGSSTTAKLQNAEIFCYTNTSAQIASRSNVATVDNYRVATVGWFDPRGREG